MSTVTATPVSANTDRHDDARLELVYRALLDLFEIPEPSPFDYASLDPKLLPPDAPRLPCSCGCGDTLVRIDEAAQGFCLGHAAPEERVAGDDEDRDARGDARRWHLDEDAWLNGLELALDGIQADPPHGYSEHEKEAFAAGQESGRLELEQDRLEFSARYEAETLALMMADPDIESRYTDAELADCNISRKAV